MLISGEECGWKGEPRAPCKIWYTENVAGVAGWLGHSPTVIVNPFTVAGKKPEALVTTAGTSSFFSPLATLAYATAAPTSKSPAP